MFRINRTNPRGVQYFMAELPNGKTEIKTGEKKIIVNHSIHRINQSWFDWIMKGEFIQKAFIYLSADEHEFLLTGITKEEWDKLFNEVEN